MLGLYSKEKGKPLRVDIVRFALIPEYSEYNGKNRLEWGGPNYCGVSTRKLLPSIGKKLAQGEQ